MSEKIAFKRNIGLFMAVMIGIGAMMGPGIFGLKGPFWGQKGPFKTILGPILFLICCYYS